MSSIFILNVPCAHYCNVNIIWCHYQLNSDGLERSCSRESTSIVVNDDCKRSVIGCRFWAVSKRMVASLKPPTTMLPCYFPHVGEAF